jgi:hypothetical protein
VTLSDVFLGKKRSKRGGEKYQQKVSKKRKKKEKKGKTTGFVRRRGVVTSNCRSSKN